MQRLLPIVLLAASDRSGAVSVRAALAPTAAWCVAVGLGTVRPLPVVVGLLLALLLHLIETRKNVRILSHSSVD